ncbi:C40 family peptidase [Streptacidiphilus rugosus]|uniref:C40 family peptidase n=1 Tax=Streptacidiphilus rugosus TaxID=405783 RepID=UPI000562303A|nr:C40 family peptidase [Streptacidiphilus rugosus]
MASHRRPTTPSRTRARVSLITAVAATGVALTAQSSSAAPTPTTGQLKAQLDQLNNESDHAVQVYDQVEEQVQGQQQKAALLQDEIARRQAKVNLLMDDVSRIAQSQYAEGAVDPTVQLMLSSDPSEFLDKASAMNQVTSSQVGELDALRSEERTLTKEKSQAEAALQALDASVRQAAAAKAAADAKVKETQKLLNSLTAKQLSAVTGGGNGIVGGHGYGSTANLGNSQPGDSIEAAAFKAAQTRIGDPYLRGGTGPSQFDCSGLMQWAYAQAGYHLGRTTYDQINYGTAVNSTADLQVGDLVFFNGAEHVGMYAGNGIILHAPHTGAYVRYEPMAQIGSIYAMRHI